MRDSFHDIVMFVLTAVILPSETLITQIPWRHPTVGWIVANTEWGRKLGPAHAW